MSELTMRDRIIRALEDLPQDATFEDAIERLVFLAKRLGLPTPGVR